MTEPISTSVEAQIPQEFFTSTTGSISADVQSARSQLIEHSRIRASSVGQLVNAFLGRFLVWPYRATSGQAFDSKGAESQAFDSLIYTSSENLTRVPADTLACAIDVHQSLGLEDLQRP